VSRQVARYRRHMRIAQIVPRGEYPWSGILTVIVHLSTALARRGHDVELWMLSPWDDAYATHLERLRTDGVRCVAIPFQGGWVRMGTAVARHAASSNIELVHLHGAFNRTNTAVSLRLEAPFVFSPHSGYDPISLRRSRSRKRLYALAFERRMLDRASMLVALTKHERDQVRAFGASGRCVVIPNGVTRPREAVDATAFRRLIHVNAETPLAVYVGRIDIYRKGLDRLLEGIAAAPEWHLAVIGPEERGDLPALEASIEGLGIATRVTVCGPLQEFDVHRALASARLFALLSRWEGLPMALLEALSHGTPALVSPEVERLVGVAADGAGWLAVPGSASRVLRNLAVIDDMTWQRTSEAATRLSTKYNWNEVAAAYEQAYTSVASRRG
jgi:glycosyltransferase involved in cell wall biosynthesis